MCMAVPGVIVAINGEFAIVSYEKEFKKCKLLVNANKGDYVIAQSGMIIKRVEKCDALKMIEAVKK